MMNDESFGKDWNGGEEDHEGYMAVAQLHRISEMADMMLEVMGENDEIPGWIQYKITRAYNDLNDAFAYIEYESHDETQQPSGVFEGRKKKKKGLWANIHARRKAGKRPKRPGEKGYPKTLDIGESIVREFIKEIVKEK
jgi:hypothetical protein